MAITWTNTIKGQFRPIDVQHMKQVTANRIKLDDYQSVKATADEIWGMVNSNQMPPGHPWSDTFKQNFRTWMDTGMPEADAAPRGAAPPTAVTWQTIKGQFRPIDISHMKQVTGGSIDLGSYESVKANGLDIYGKVSTGEMPPGNRWSPQYVANFKAWMDAGYPQG